MPSSSREIIEQVEDLIPKPEISLRINTCLADDNSSIGDVVTIIESDPSITTRIMRIANSAFYGYQGQIDSVNRAVMLIGLNGVRDLVWACDSISRFTKVKMPAAMINAFWEHSLFLAMSARVLAAKCKLPSSERLFVTGLLCKVGVLALWQVMPERMQGLWDQSQEKGIDLVKLEQQSLGFDHNEVGALLLSKWQLPASIVDVVGSQEKSTFMAEHASDLAIIQIAKYIAHSSGFGYGGKAEAEQVPHSAWQRVGLSERIVDAVRNLILEDFADVKHGFLGSDRGLAA